MHRLLLFVLASFALHTGALAEPHPDASDQFKTGYAAEREAAAAQKSNDRAAEVAAKARALQAYKAGCEADDGMACARIAEEGYINAQIPAAERGAQRTAYARRAAKLLSDKCRQMRQAQAMTAEVHCVRFGYFVRGLRNSDSYYPAAERTDGLKEYTAPAAEIMFNTCMVDMDRYRLDCLAAGTLLEVTDPAKAREYRTIICEADVDWGCEELGQLSATQAKEVRALETQCSRDAKACFQLGAFYATRPKMPQAGEKARQYMGKSCDAGVGKSCSVLGTIHVTSRFGPVDYKAALVAFEKHCKLGDADAGSSCKAAETIRRALPQ